MEQCGMKAAGVGHRPRFWSGEINTKRAAIQQQGNGDNCYSSFLSLIFLSFPGSMGFAQPLGDSSVPLLISSAQRMKCRLDAKPKTAQAWCQTGHWMRSALTLKRIIQPLQLVWVRSCTDLSILNMMKLHLSSPPWLS